MENSSTSNLRTPLTGPQDILEELARLAEELEEKKGIVAEEVNFSDALWWITDKCGNEMQRKQLSFSAYHNYNSPIPFFIAAASYFSRELIPPSMADVSYVTKMTTLPIMLLVSFFYLQGVWCKTKNAKVEKEFCKQPENQLLVSQAHSIVAESANIRALQARYNHLSTQYDTLGPEGKLPENFGPLIEGIAMAAEKGDEHEIGLFMNDTNRILLLKEPLFRNALIVACAERQALPALFDALPELRRADAKPLSAQTFSQLRLNG